MKVAPKGHPYLVLGDALETAILREWERRWPTQKWRTLAEVSTSSGWKQAKGDFTPEARAKARAAVEAVLDFYANRG